MQADGRCDPPDERQLGYLLSVAPGILKPEVGPGEAAEGTQGGERPATQRDLVSDAAQVELARGRPEKLLSPVHRPTRIEHVRQALNVSERRACRVLGQHPSMQRKVPQGGNDQEQLTADIIELGPVDV